MNIRKYLTLLLLPALALLAACNDNGGTAGAGGSVALIDQNRLYMESQTGKKGMEMLQGMSGDMQSQLQSMQEEMAKEGTEQEKQERSRRFQQTLSAAQAKMGAEQTRIVGILQENVTAVLDEFRKERGIAVVLPVENALSYDKSLDITDDVIAALDKRSIDLSKPAEQGATPAGEPEEQPAPAVEKPAEQPAQPAEPAKPAEPAQPAEPAKPAQ